MTDLERGRQSRLVGGPNDAAPSTEPRAAQPPTAVSAKPRYEFIGTGLELLGKMLVDGLLDGLTCFVWSILGLPAHRSSRWSVERTCFDGAPARYTARWTDELGLNLVSQLLLWLTCGFAAPWIVVMRERFRVEHTEIADGRRARFDGSALEVIGLLYGGFVLLVVTLGLAWPVLFVMYESWRAKHTVLEDPRAGGGTYRLRFDGGIFSYFLPGMLSLLLVWITFGLYVPWAIAGYRRWAWSATSDDVSPRIDVPNGPRTPAQWAAAISLGAGAVLTLLLALLLGLSVAGRSPLRGATDSTPSSASSEPAWTAPAPGRPVAPAGGDTLGERRLYPSDVRASSYRCNRGRDCYPPRQVSDGSLRTCWAEGVAGLGVGEWLELELGAEHVLTRLVLVPGYDKWHPRSGDLFLANASVRRFRLEADGGWSRSHTTERGQRRAELDLPGVRTRRLRLVVEDVWPGTRWQDTCVSEVELYGR